MDINCIVDIASREVSFQENYRIAAYDHNVDVIRFSIEPIEDFSLDTSSIKIAAQGPNKARHDYAVDPSTVAIEEETGYITFDWPIPAGVTEMPIGTFKYGDKGQLIFAVCAEIISGDTVSKAWHSDDGIITVVAHLEPESGGGEDPSEVATNAQKIAQLQTNVAVMGTQIGALANGSPTPVATVAEMTDESAVYLYTGSETGYTAGNWYYYNGTAWTSGGVYGGATTSTTFDKHGVPADDFAVGEALDTIDGRLDALEGDTTAMTTATSSDAGKALKAKTITNGKVTEWEFGEAGSSIELDSTLTNATKAAPAKTVGDLLYFDGGESGGVISQTGTLVAYIDNSNVIKSVTADDCRIVYYAITGGKTYTITKTVTSSACKAGFTSATPAVKVSCQSVYNKGSGFTGSFDVTAPSNASYLVIYYAYNDSNYTNILASITVTTQTQINIKRKIGLMEDDMSIFGGYIDTKDVTIGTEGILIDKIVSDQDTWQNKTGGSYMLPIDADTALFLATANSQRDSYVTFLRSPNTSAVDFCMGARKINIPQNTTRIIRIPDDAKYINIQRLYYSNGNNCELQNLVAIRVKSRNIDTEDTVDNDIAMLNNVGFMSDSNGRDVPMFKGVLNAYKKAHQLTDIVWTALAAIPTNTNASGCAAGQHTGILYSEALQFEKYVGYGCSIKSFMTAIHNPYSVMYTEDTKGTAARKKSAYGFTYLNTTGNGAFYGAVCSSLTSWACGMPIMWQSGDMAWLARTGLFAEVYDNSADGARLMDIVWVSGHVQLITDIYRNNRGEVTSIVLSEGAMDYCHTHTKTKNEFNTYIVSQHAKLYRYRDLYKNTEYAASPFVAIENETLSGSYQYNDDICTYLGDYVSIADWESMYINYAKGSYTSMELYKGTTLIQTLTLPDSYNDTHSIDVTSYLTGAGEYKARLTDGTNNSDYTYFEVVNTNATAVYDSETDTLVVTFSSSNGKPMYIRIKNADGHVISTYVLTDVDKYIGKCSYNPKALKATQGRTAPDNKVQYVRVFYAGKYNQVMGGYVDSGIVTVA